MKHPTLKATLPTRSVGMEKASWPAERNVLEACTRSFVIRTCGLYGPTRSPGKGNFIKTMLSLAESRKELNVVDDQRCTPTLTFDLAHGNSPANLYLRIRTLSHHKFQDR